MITNKCFWHASALLFVGSLAGGLLCGGDTQAPPPPSRALWAFETDNPRALVEHADAIALVEAVATHPGRIATSELGEDVLPFELTEFRVIDMVKGSSTDGRIFVERVGGVDPTTGDVVSIDSDGGAFEIGVLYIVLLKQQPGGDAFVQVNEQARFQVRDGKLVAASDGALARGFAGRSMSVSLSALRMMLE